MEVLELRAHHINCIFFYEGKGYSDGFVKEMDKVVEQLKRSDSQLISLKKDNDRFCNACPHLREGKCISYRKIHKLDQDTLKTYGLEEGKIYPFNMIKEQIYKNYDESLFEKICSGCEWYKQGVCSKEKIKNQQMIWG